MNLRTMVFGLPAVLGLAVFAIACGDDGGAAEESGPDQFDVSVQFNASATQDDLFEVEALLRSFDDDLEYVIMEIFPPIGCGMLATDTPDFCQTVEAELEAKSYVDSVSCGPPPSGEPTGDGEVSVTNVPTMGSVAPDTFLTFDGQRYRAVDVLQASLIPEDEFQEIGVATEADIDYEGELKVYRRQGDDTAVYTFSPPLEIEGEEGDVPALWLRWEPAD